jgi:homoserine O-acetyltransferase
MCFRAVVATALISIAGPVLAEPENANWPNYYEGDFIIGGYAFASGQILPQVKLHYRTLGTAERNAAGQIVNGILLLQGNTGTGANWLRPTLADELFKDGQPLDARRYFIVIPDALGRVARASPPMGSRVISRTTVITTWSTACTGLSPRGSRWAICASLSAVP